MPASNKRDRFTSVLAREILADGPDALIAWADALAETTRAGYKKSAFAKAAGLLAQESPERAARWVEANLGKPWAFEAQSTVGQRWAEQDPMSAFNWVRALPPSLGRDRAVALTFREWHQMNPVQAENWLAEAPRERSLDPARALLIRRTVTTSPASTLEVLELITDPTIREECVVQIGWNWRRTDLPAAEAWLEQLELSDESKGAILHERRPGRRLQERAMDAVAEPWSESNSDADVPSIE
jgi:hypothetical protein